MIYLCSPSAHGLEILLLLDILESQEKWKECIQLIEEQGEFFQWPQQKLELLAKFHEKVGPSHKLQICRNF